MQKTKKKGFHKAINSQETAPKRKHVRQIVLETWKTGGTSAFFQHILKEPIETNGIVAFKTLHVIHKILHEGPARAITDCSVHLDLFSRLASVWSRKEERGYGRLVMSYALFLREKVCFHVDGGNLYTGGFSIAEFDKNSPLDSINVEQTLPKVGTLLDLQASLIKIESLVFTFEGKNLNECRMSILIPLTVESYALYSITVHVLRRICYCIDSMDIVSPLLERFYTQYHQLRALYEDTSRLQYVISIIAVPTLPRDPPSFELPRKVQHSHVESPMPQMPEVVVPQASKQLNVGEMESMIASTTTFATPVQGQAADLFSSFGSGNGAGGWVTFSGPRATQQPSPFEPLVAPDQMFSGAAMAAGSANNELEMLRKRVAELEKKNGSLEKQNADLQLQVRQRTEAIEKWKQGYSQLLRTNQELQNERVTLYKTKASLQGQLQATVQAHAEKEREMSMREIGDALAALQQCLYKLGDPSNMGNEHATVDAVAHKCKELRDTFSEAIALAGAGDMGACAVQIRRVGVRVGELMADAKGLSRFTESMPVKQALLDAVRNAAGAAERLLDALQSPNPDKAELDRLQSEFDRALADVVGAVNRIGTEETDGAEDIADLATQELQNAARIIEEAAAALVAAQREQQATKSGGEVSAAILDAVMAITRATAALIQSASVNQAELVKKGRAGGISQWYHKNRAWSEGLISAAKAVANSTAFLAKTANDAVSSDDFAEEALIAASKAVAMSTTQLVVASRVKSDPDSAAHRNLGVASANVTSATNKLVEAARAFMQQKDAVNVKTAAGFTSSKIQEMEQQMLILKLERELRVAREHLGEMRKNEYSA